MVVKTAYEMTNEELLREFGQACAEARLSNSGFVVDVMGPVHASEARYLKGVVLARLDGQKPPFSRGDVVQSKSGDGARAVGWHGRLSGASEPHEIFRVHYLGNEKWLLEFRNLPEGMEGTPLFQAEEFVLVSVPTPAV